MLGITSKSKHCFSDYLLIVGDLLKNSLLGERRFLRVVVHVAGIGTCNNIELS